MGTIKFMDEKEQKDFWRRHEQSRKAINKRLMRLPFAKKIELIDTMKANHEAMRNAKGMDT